MEIKKHHFRDVDKKRTAIKAVVYKTVALANWAKAACKGETFIIYKAIIVKLLKSFNFDTLILANRERFVNIFIEHIVAFS